MRKCRGCPRRLWPLLYGLPGFRRGVCDWCITRPVGPYQKAFWINTTETETDHEHRGS